MNDRVRALLWKEWIELRSRKGLIVSTLLPPAILLAMSLGLGVLAVLEPGMVGEDDFPPAVVEELVRLHPALGALSTGQIGALFLARQLFQFLLLPPLMTAMGVATHSIIGEKVSRSLEPLLSTPLTTLELLLGKSLAAAIPAILLSWATGVVYALVLWSVAPPELFAFILDWTAVCLLLVFAPLVAVLGLSLGVVVSSRASDPRSAQQIGAVVVIPVVALFIAQLQGLFFLTPALVLGAAVVLAGIDVLVLFAGVRLFDRETILTRWK
jgi:ABC-2 type transport system permease protein